MIVPPVVETLLTISRKFFHTPYQDDNVLSVSILTLCVSAGFFLLSVPLKILTCCLKNKAYKVVDMILTITMSITCLLVGLVFIFLLVMTSFGRWYLGAPLAILFWITSFILLNRKPQTQEYQNFEDEDEPKVYSKPTIKERVIGYFESIRRGVTDRLPFTFVFITGIVLFTLAASLATCNVCVTYAPIEFSTSMTRRVFGQGKICEYNKICYNYLTVPEDISTSMIVNFHFYGYTIEKGFVRVYLSQQSEHVQYNATCFRMENIVDEERYQCWSDVTGLTPNTSYHYTTHIQVQGLFLISSTPRRFRTGPSNSTQDGFSFTTGGDLEWSKGGIALAKEAAASNPLFSMVGGDIAYANGDPHCYRRWDFWFTQWTTHMITADNHTIPILTCIGNHEAGNFKLPRWRIAFYLRYFPHETGLQSIDPQERPLTHAHVFGSHSVLVALDSWTLLTPAQQVPWLRTQLAKYAHLRNKFALYHLVMYPPKAHIVQIDADIMTAMRQEWKPLFDQYGLTAAFENHFHCYKTTHPIRNDTVVGLYQGTRYFGDGAFGQKSKVDTVFSTSSLIQTVGNHEHIFVIRAESFGSNTTSLHYDGGTVKVLETNLLA